MKNTIKGILNGFIAAGVLLAGGSAGCGSSTSSDVAYEDDYAGDYYYPADVAYSGVYAGGWGYYGVYAATPAGTGASAAALLDGGRISIDAGHITIDGGRAVDAGRGVDGGRGNGSTTVREAVGQAIREAALGNVVCAGQATVTPRTGNAVCGVSAAGVKIVFSGCQLSGGGTVDGTVDVQITRSSSDTTCNSSTSITLGYTSTITGLTYTGTGGGKIVIPNDMSTSTLTYSLGQSPTTASIQTNGEIQRFASGGSMSLRPDVQRDVHVLVDLAGRPDVHGRRNAERDGQERRDRHLHGDRHHPRHRLLPADRRNPGRLTQRGEPLRIAHLDVHLDLRVGDARRQDGHASELPVTSKWEGWRPPAGWGAPFRGSVGPDRRPRCSRCHGVCGTCRMWRPWLQTR